jgi:hypothetical protein
MVICQVLERIDFTTWVPEIKCETSKGHNDENSHKDSSWPIMAQTCEICSCLNVKMLTENVRERVNRGNTRLWGDVPGIKAG